jgi:hypothetical protein
VLLIVGAVVVAFLTILSFSVFYQAPSCSDNKQNEGEAGVDCGGPCAYLCAESERAPQALFTRPVPNGEGRIDVVSEIENRNQDAGAKNASYTITFYAADATRLGSTMSGAIDLPPNSVTPVFVPGAPRGTVRALLEVVTSSLRWISMPTDRRIVPTATPPRLFGTASAPRVESILVNPSTRPLTNVRVIAFVYDSQDNIIAASATLVATIPPQGRASALFIWNAPFAGVPALIKITPVVPLP